MNHIFSYKSFHHINSNVRDVLNTFENYAKKKSYWHGKPIIYFDESTNQLGVITLTFWQQLKWRLGWRDSIFPLDRVYRFNRVMKELNSAETNAHLLHSLKGAELLAQRYLTYLNHRPAFAIHMGDFAKEILEPYSVPEYQVAAERAHQEMSRRIVANYFQDLIANFQQEVLEAIEEEISHQVKGINCENLSLEDRTTLAHFSEREGDLSSSEIEIDDTLNSIYQHILPQLEEESELAYQQRLLNLAHALPPSLLLLHLQGKSPKALAIEIQRHYMRSSTDFSMGNIFGSYVTRDRFDQYLARQTLTSEMKEGIYTAFQWKPENKKEKLDILLDAFEELCAANDPTISLMGKRLIR